jgi:manganese/iron transport system ATP-binding protein
MLRKGSRRQFVGLLNELQKTKSFIRRRHLPHQADVPILRTNGLSLRYETRYALEDISFELVFGERLAVVGPNGAGKSTLFQIIAGVLDPTSGEVEVFGNEPDGHICIAFVPQRTQVDWNFPVSVKDVVMMGRIGKMGLFRWPGRQDWQVVHQSLEVVSMDHLADRQISELSGGQQQRMFIARALAQEAELMLMDEPLAGLDLTSQDEIFQILDRLQDKKVTVMVALHDLKLAAERFDRVLLLNHKLLGLGKPAEVFETQALLQAYGSHLRVLHTDAGFLALDDSCCDDGIHFHD